MKINRYFFSDLDNTLIYSYKKKIAGEKKLVELYNGRQQSFMSRYTFDFLINMNNTLLIPVTTRNKVQFERIDVFRNELKCKYSIVCNGGMLLVDGHEDEDWTAESEVLIRDELEELIEIKNKVCNLLPNVEFREVQGFFFYFVSDSHQLAMELTSFIKRNITFNKCELLLSGRKAYFMPKTLSKGNAIKRFKDRFGDGMSIAAGDSEMDIPMLNCVDIALILPELSDSVLAPEKRIINGSLFSDRICDYLKLL